MINNDTLIFKPNNCHAVGFDRIEECQVDSPDGLRRYCIQVVIPEKKTPDQGYTALFMLDGNAVFNTLIQAKNIPFPPHKPLPLVICLGYDTEVTSVADGRAFDYTPLIPEVADLHDPRAPERKAGGADMLITWMAQTLIPQIVTRYKANVNAKGLYGHSYGGLCVLHTMLTHPTLFEHWIAVSPSLWWHNHYMEKKLHLLIEKQTLPSPISMTLMAGTQEQLRKNPVGVNGSSLHNRPAGIPTLPWVQALSQKLSTIHGLDLQFLELMGADHRGALHMSIPQSLKIASNWS